MSRTQFRTDVLALLDSLDKAACARYLPDYLPHGADITRMTRSARMVGDLRRGTAADETGSTMRRNADGRALTYALPAERGTRVDAPQTWEQLAVEYQQLVVLADPGMGKSWLMRAETHRLALVATEKLADTSAAVEDVLIPVPIRADALAAAPGRDLAEVISSYLVEEQLLHPRSAALMSKRVAGGGVVLLIDALDEVPREAATAGGQAPAKRLEDLLRQWAAACPDARCVLTSRLAGYSGPPLPEAREAELLPFTPQDTKTAIQAWDLPNQAVSRIDQLLDDPGVAGMARVPLLLALICSLAVSSKDGNALPSTRVELYEAVLSEFLSGSHRMDYKSPAARLTGEERQGLLRILATVAFSFATTRQGWVDRMPYGALAAAISGAGTGAAITEPGGLAAEKLLRRCVEAGVLVPSGNSSGGQTYMFLHRTIAEYLTACHLVNLPPAQRMKAVAEHQWFEPDWAEVIPMLGGLLARSERAEAKALLTHFLSQWPDPLHRAFCTAIRILGEQPDSGQLLDPSHAQLLTKRVTGLLRQDLTRRRLLTATATWPRPLVDALLSLLHHHDKSVRFAAARALADRPNPVIIQALLPLLRDSYGSTRSAAVEGLADCPDPAITQALLPLLRDSEGYVRASAVRAIADHADPSVAHALIDLIHDSEAGSEKDGDARRAAAQALPVCLASVTTDTLISLLHDTDIDVRWAAADALASRQDPATAQALLLLLRDSNEQVQSAAARALAGHQDPATTQALLPLLRDSNSGVKWVAIHALAGRPDATVTQAMLPLLSDSESGVRWAAAGALASRPDPVVTEALLPVLRDSDSRVRWTAAGALDGRQDPAVTQALLPLLHDSDSSVRSTAVHALADRQDPAVTQALIALLDDGDSWVRITTVQALAGQPEAAITQALIPLLHDSDDWVQSEAFRALAGRPDPVVTQALIGVLRDTAGGSGTHRGLRSDAVRELARRPDPTVSQVLLPLLRDSDMRVRDAASSALAKHRNAGVTEALLSFLRDSDGGVRSAAVNALAGDLDPTVTRALLPLLRDSESYVQTRTVYALARRTDVDVTEALLPLLHDSDNWVQSVAVRALAERSEPQLVAWVARRGAQTLPAAQLAVLYDLADRITDRDYLRLPPRDRARVWRRLGKLTRKAAPVPGQRLSTSVSRFQAVTRGASARLRRRRLRAAAAFAIAIVAGVIGGKLSGKLTPGLAVFAVLMVGGMTLASREERGPETADTKEAGQYPG